MSSAITSGSKPTIVKHFNTFLYDKKVHIRVIEDGYENWTTAQWLEYDRKWKAIEDGMGKEETKTKKVVQPVYEA